MAKPEQIGGQVKQELDEFIEFVRPYEPKTYLEIGAREGIALRYFVEALPSIEHVTVVDLPGADWGRSGSDTALRKNLDAMGRQWTLHIGDSTSTAVIEAVAETAPYDVIFIDGDHTYAGVHADWTNYSRMSRIVALHDINHPPDSRAYGPTRLWNELALPPDRAIIAKGSRKGIGVMV